MDIDNRYGDKRDSYAGGNDGEKHRCTVVQGKVPTYALTIAPARPKPAAAPTPVDRTFVGYSRHVAARQGEDVLRFRYSFSVHRRSISCRHERSVPTAPAWVSGYLKTERWTEGERPKGLRSHVAYASDFTPKAAAADVVDGPLRRMPSLKIRYYLIQTISIMDIRRLDLNLLLLLDGLFRAQNLSAVSRQLGMSQPMASAGLRKLRDFFGDPMFCRPGAAWPTPFAESIAEAVRTVLSPSISRYRASCRKRAIAFSRSRLRTSAF
jgi:hypothetical protein